MTRQPRFEIVRGDNGWWARFRAANGRVVFVTETYKRRRGALNAIEAICDAEVYLSPHQDWPEIAWGHSGFLTEIRECDEREAS